MTLLVRDIRPADRDAWEGLFRAYGVFYETDLGDAVLDQVWAALLSGALHGYVAETHGVVVGFAHARSHVSTFSIGDDWYLEDLYVDAEARSRGVGTAILEHLVAVARRDVGGTLRWITAESNATAQRVYDRVATRTTWVTYEVDL